MIAAIACATPSSRFDPVRRFATLATRESALPIAMPTPDRSTI